MSLADQLEEVEALESIFPEYFTKISVKAPNQYKILIFPNSDGGGENHGNYNMRVLLRCFDNFNLYSWR